MAVSAFSNIAPVLDQPFGHFHQALSWQVTESDWNREGHLILNINTKIPGTLETAISNSGGGGAILLVRGSHIGATRSGAKGAVFATYWPSAVKLGDVSIDANIKIKRGSEEVGQFSLRNYQQIKNNFNCIVSKDAFTVDPNKMDLFDVTKSFTVEAEIVVIDKVSGTNGPDPDLVSNELTKDLVTIFNSEKTSDVDIRCSGKVFKCHRNILCARSVVFKMILLGDSQEKVEKTVEIRDSTVEAVEEMLKYIYTGEIPLVAEKLTLDLLKLADMYDLATLKIACGEAVLTKLNIDNCISSFIMVDRFFTLEARVRKMIDLFMRCKAKKVVDSDEWDQLINKCPGSARELMRAMVSGGKEAHGCWYCN